MARYARVWGGVGGTWGWGGEHRDIVVLWHRYGSIDIVREYGTDMVMHDHV